jgi:Ca2+-binding EF-hand superfamily protein
LFLKNGFRKFAIDGSNRISLKDMRLFVVRALGCGAGAVNLSHLSSPFREDSKDGVERMNFTKMMAAYMQHAKSSKKQSATNF